MSAFLLASASPRRRELLTQVGLRFDVEPADVDETPHEHELPGPHVERLARSKALAVARGSDRFVLAADTVVVRDQHILGKPTDAEHAKAMLRSLGGRSHEVTTGVALARGGAVLASLAVTTVVEFRAMSEGEIARYVETGEGADKAGSYAIQGIAGGFVIRISGSYSNVVGLPLVETLGILQRHGAVTAWP